MPPGDSEVTNVASKRSSHPSSAKVDSSLRINLHINLHIRSST